MAALLEYLKHWFSSLFGTVKQEFDGTVKKEEVVEKDIVKPIPTEVFEKDIVKDVSKILEANGVKVVGEVKVTSDDQIEIKEVKTCKPLRKSSKLTMDQARAIRADRDIKTIKELATEYSVSTDTIRRILDNKTYKEC